MRPPRFRVVVDDQPEREIGPLPKFQPYEQLAAVPEPVRQKIRELNAKYGVPYPEIAALIEIPPEWVEEIIEIGRNRDNPRGKNPPEV